MRRILAATFLSALALSVGSGEVSANIVFTFDGVTFSDGGTLTGTFTTNDALDTLVDFDITTSPGTDIGFTYTPATAVSGSTSLPFILVLSESGGTTNLLQVTFDNLTASGSPITIGTFDSFEQGTTANARRDITAGQVVVQTTAVPEPSTLALAGIGALGLVSTLRRRRAV